MYRILIQRSCGGLNAVSIILCLKKCLLQPFNSLDITQFFYLVINWFFWCISNIIFRAKTPPLHLLDDWTVLKYHLLRQDSESFSLSSLHSLLEAVWSHMQSKYLWNLKKPLDIIHFLISDCTSSYDKEFRKLLVTNVPAIEPVLEVFLDDSNPLADVQKKFEEYSAKMNEYTSYVKNLFGSDDKAKTDDVVKPMKSMLMLLNIV